MHATTLEVQHQAKNGPDALLGVWRLNLVWPSSKINKFHRDKFCQKGNITMTQKVFTLQVQNNSRSAKHASNINFLRE